MAPFFGSVCERRDPDGTWTPIEDAKVLKMGDVIRTKDSATALTVSCLKTVDSGTSFIANRIETSTGDPLKLMHLEGVEGDFPPEKFPLPVRQEVGKDESPSASGILHEPGAGMLPEVTLAAGEVLQQAVLALDEQGSDFEVLWPKHANVTPDGSLPVKGGFDDGDGEKDPPPKSNKSSRELIFDALDGGTEKSLDSLIAFFSLAGKKVKSSTVSWQLGQMAKAGEVEKTESGTWKLKART